ncbi:MAG: D-sedoheptulose 7-phosphate isomerase [Desulfomicrobiaceae bacterium]|nr:D-sedoheptulose 7-phosphate isomerase [Desulfomicrobiaceae bacterium]
MHDRTWMHTLIARHAHEGAVLREQYLAAAADEVAQAAEAMAQVLHRGGKLLVCGNGGSAADAQHFAAELVNRFAFDRPALAAVALTVDTSILTAVANDTAFEAVFARQVEALGRPEDLLVAISTSGRSPNVLAALQAARQRGLQCLGLCGAEAQRMAPLCHHLLAVPHTRTALVQEVHITLIHLLCELVERTLFSQSGSEW